MVSINELERRWKALRAEMSKHGFDWIICEGTFRKLGGYPSWFTDRVPVYNTMIAFPIEGDLYYISHGGGHHKPVDSPGVKHLVKPYIQTLHCNTGAELALEVLNRKKPSRVGFAGYGTLSAAAYTVITKSLPDTEFLDASDIVDGVKAVKSEEEVECFRHTAEIYGRAWEVAIQNVKIGRTPTEVLKKVTQLFVDSGSSEWIAIAGAAPQDDLLGASPDRVMKEGDVFLMMTEFNGPEGYYNELLRRICISRVPKELEQTFEDVKEAQENMAKLVVPGADPNEILKETDRFLGDRGYPPEERLAGHGQGYDLVERPAFSPCGETFNLKAGMVISLHPCAAGKKVWGLISDNFLVTETGGVRLSKVPQETFVV